MIHCIDARCSRSFSNDPDRHVSLADFELEFWYPLGPENSFRIEHGDDYTLFFRAMGRAATFYAERGGVIQGVVSVVLRTLNTPSGQTLDTAYFCDLKVLPSARGGFTAARLLQRSASWALENVPRAYSVVMGGTTRSPTRYTGRLGIPSFEELGEITILRIPISQAACAIEDVVACPVAEVKAHFERLTVNKYRPQTGFPELRSQVEPCGLIHRGMRSCGVLEDTRRAKRLYDRQGNEMISAHLSNFAFQTSDDGALLIRGAMNRCRQQNIPALFLAVSADEAKPLLTALGIADVVQAPATVFGHGLPATGQWCISTAEI